MTNDHPIRERHTETDFGEPFMSEASIETPTSAWLLRVASVEAAPLFSQYLATPTSLLRGIQPSDAVCVVSHDGYQAIGIARVFRTRAELGGTRIYFDGQSPIRPERPLTEFGIELPVERHTSENCSKFPPLTTCWDRLADPRKKSSA